MLIYKDVFIYILLMSVSSIWVDNLGLHFYFPFLLFICSGISIIFYNLFISDKKRVYSTISQSPMRWIFLNLSLTLVWFLTYFSIIVGSPRLFFITYYLIVSIIASSNSKKYVQAMSCALLLLLTYWVLPEVNFKTIMSTLLCGISGYVYIKTSHGYAKKFKLKSHEMLGIRFYCLFMVSGLMALYAFHSGISISDHHFTLLVAGIIILVLAVANLILPNFFSQSSIINLGPEKHSFAISVIPLVVFIVQGDMYSRYDLFALGICLMLIVFINIDKLIRYGQLNIKK